MVTPKLTYALEYVKTVKDKFKDTRQKFDEFLEVIVDFRAEKIDTYGVILKVKELFKDQQELLLGFDSFLPEGWKITLGVDQTPPKEPVTFEEAVIFVKNVKARFQDNDRPYRSFLDSLNMYRNNNRSLTEVLEELAFLFRDHYDLFVEFTRFTRQ
ncbi:BnaA07g24000D [Brassica napus]|nr:BnaC06g24970D [Brassica napus]CDY48381.1 BnaA07g24000D [Brassica napus]